MTLYITGAGVSKESGIPTFRGEEGYWTIGSKNYTPESMATRAMYTAHPDEFLSWYYKRFIAYRDVEPNSVHEFLADKNLITQNIDGLDAKAGNKHYIPIHGRVDMMARFAPMESSFAIYPAPWDAVDQSNLIPSLFDVFNISNGVPVLHESYKPFVLLFDEYYTEEFRFNEAIERMRSAKRMVFMGTSFSVGITAIALEIARDNRIPIEIVDPNPIQVMHANAIYHRMKACDYVKKIC
jgi:NAD-dependent deacetylase